MAKLEFTNLNTILFSKEDVFFVTIKKNITQTDDGDPILVWFENNSTSKPEYWNIERDYDCSDYTSRTNSFSLFSPKTQTDTISLAISLKQDVDIPPSTSLTIKCELSSVNETDKATTTLYYQSSYNPFSISSDIYESNPNYNIPDDSDGTKQLLRTNPKLSGNIKITIDSNNNVWLNTIDANIELSANRFKKYKVSSNNSYAYDLRKFLDDGRLETKSVFFIDGQDNSSSKTEYSEQYKTQYWSGSEYLPSLFYNEEFSIFSPLWIDKTIPDYFVIFSSESVVNDSQKDFTYNFKENIIKNSKILKVFSLKEGTTIGNYIRGIINSNSYKSSPINVIFDKDFPTITYRGIDFKNGVYTEKNVIADDLITEDNPITFFEKRIIDGFEKNDLICYNLLNLEFLFDDNQAYEYDINRYFGFYINENELSKFVIDEESMSNLYSWIPENKFKIDNNSEIEIFDDQGISIIADLNSPEQPKIPSSQLISDLEHIFYVKGKYNLYKIDDTEILQSGSNGFKMKSVGKIKTSQKKFDLSDITGFSSTKIIAKSELKDNAGFPFYIQNIDKYRDADSISLIYQKGGMQKEWKVVANSYAVSKGSTLEQEFISSPIDINVCANINTITSYDDYNVGKIFIPELLDFSIGSDVLLDYGYKILSATIQSIKTTTLSSGNDTFVVASTSNLKVNQPVIGTGIQPNTYITDIDTATNTITISQNATISGSSSITFCASVLIQGEYANNISDGDILTAKDLINLTSYQLSVSEDSFLISGNTAVPLQTAQIITKIESNPSNYLVRFSGLKIASASDYTTKEAYLVINTNIFNVLSTTGLSVNQPVSGNGIPSGAYITAINTLTNAITISKNATKTGLSNLTFSSSIKLEGNLTSLISSGDNLTIKNLTTDVTYQVFVNASPIAISNYTIVPLENASIIDDVISNLTNFSVRLLVDNPSIFKSKTCEIVDVEKDTDSYFTYLHIKDSTKSVLNTLNKSSDIFIHIYYYNQSIYNYFNPVGSESEYLSSIVKAFNTFDNKKFTASYVNNALVLRSEFEEDAYFKIKIDLLGNSTELSSILIHNVESLGLEIGKDSSNTPIYKKIITAEYNNPKQRKVFTIPKEYSNNITGDEWVKTINSNKKLKPYQIQNSTTYYLYTEDENKLELELVESVFPELDKESNVVFLNLHRNSLGVMSFLPIVDFDFDFLDSDYSYLPSEELKKYFKAYYPGDSLPINEIYRVFCEQGVVISLYAVKTNGDRIKVQPTNTVESGKVRTISLDTSTNLISMHTIPALYSETIGNIEISHFVFESTNPINIANKTYFQNVTSWSTKNISGRNESETGEFGIIQFEGFNTITDFIESTELQEINRLREINSVDRFSNFILASEYEVLRENYNKNLFNLGRVIPYINKWVSQHSSDVRSNEYRLNTSLAFGDKGFSPDNLIKDPSPIVFTHEWYYIEGMPSWYSDSAAKKDKNYTFSSILDTDLYSTEYDGFVRSFIRGNHKELYEGNVLNTETKKLYTYVKFDKQLNKAVVFFKGAKFQLNVSTPSIYDNWKFTAVLRPRRRSPFSKGGDITYKLVENKKWKTLTFIIDAYLPNYSFPERELNLLGLYTSQSSKQISISSGAYDKFVFSDSDIQLSGGLVPTFDSVTLSGNYISVKTTSDLTNEINRVGNQNYSDIRVFGYGKRQEDINIGNIYLQFYGRNINEISTNNITFNYNPNDNLPDSNPTDGLAIGYEFLANTKRPFYPPIHINYLLETPSSFLNSSSYYIKGGHNYLKSLIRDISFASIKEIMEASKYSHIIISENGDITTEDISTTFGFTYVMPSTINKRGLLQVSPDKDVPNQFSLENVIGYNLSVTDYNFQVVRYGGDFIPKTKEIVNFTAAESLKFIEEFGTGNKKNTRFFFNHNSFGILKNQALHKVSEKKILSLSDSEKYKPVYPLLNESGIDYKDISIISTNWDYDFYRNYSSKVIFSSLSPLIEPKEIKSFLGSKLANTPMTLLVESFEYANSLDNSKDFWYEIKDSTISIHLLAENILLKNLKTDKFRENLINSISKLRNNDLFTEEFFEEYILTNLVKIYKVSSIKLFYRGDRKEQEIFLNTDEQTRNTLSFTEVPGIYVENRIEDILIKKSIGELSNPQLSLSITFEKI